jgi:hypothetical protein
MKAVGTVLSPLGKALGIFGGGPGKKPRALPQVTRDESIINRDRLDELARRRGGAADVLTGTTGAEAPMAAGKAVLGQ